ncbi:MAG TPA: hypothetical protein VFG76_11315 [Candidatus Polarisedimenticolia bacterium]|nr:hypothetical protein [Candidatus Polarisedimenticolia bacterium]
MTQTRRPGRNPRQGVTAKGLKGKNAAPAGPGGRPPGRMVWKPKPKKR